MILKDENLSEDVDIDKLAERTVDYSGSDLHELCRCAAMNSFIEHIKLVNTSATDTAAEDTAAANSAIFIRRVDFNVGFQKMSVKNLTNVKNRFNLTEDTILD